MQAPNSDLKQPDEAIKVKEEMTKE